MSNSKPASRGRKTPLRREDRKPRALRPLHRISAVRRQEGMSLRGIARKLRVEIGRLREQEKETTDLQLSDLYMWQRALRVPVADLLVESEPSLSTPVMKRAQMVKLMKTATSIMENCENVRVQRMVKMLLSQLIEMMPELDGVAPWPAVGQRRTLDEQGRAVDRCAGMDLRGVLEYTA